MNSHHRRRLSLLPPSFLSAPSNIKSALEKAAAKYDGGDGQISYSNFRKISREFPFLLHPAFRLQEKFMTEVRVRVRARVRV